MQEAQDALPRVRRDPRDGAKIEHDELRRLGALAAAHAQIAWMWICMIQAVREDLFAIEPQELARERLAIKAQLAIG